MERILSKKVYVISLGCDKNRVDTEKMLWYLSAGSYEVTDDAASAEIIIVNTCAFIESARQEAIDTILSVAEYKHTGACEKLIVTGCLVVNNADELKEGLPEVDAFLGIDEYHKIRTLFEPVESAQESDGRILTTPPHYAYLRIADGCDNFCTFCTIPSIRGKYCSRTIESIVCEARDLVTKGVKELILVAQDVTSYGKDIYGQLKLIELLRELSKTDVTWLRLMYCYPELVTDELINEIASNDKIVKYIDVPMQHVADGVLKRMNRHNNFEQACVLCDKLKERNIALRTTFMVGFPGESEEDFSKLMEFTEKYAPEHVGIFAYSLEEGTPSAKLKGHLLDEVKLDRVDALGELHLKNVLKKNAAMVGSVIDVIYEDVDYEKGLFRGRTAQDAPEIDSIVYFTGEFADVGNIYKVKITDYDDYDLIGEMI